GGDRLLLRKKKPAPAEAGPAKAAKSPSLVLVSGAAVAAAEEAVIDAEFEEGYPPGHLPPKERKRSGGGSGSGGGGGGIRPPTPKIDRAFNQDDLVSVLIVLALLILAGLFLIRGNGGPAKPEQLASVQSVAAKPPEPAAPIGPPPDPYGDK